MKKNIAFIVFGTSLLLNGCTSKLAVEHSATGNGVVVSTPTIHILTKNVELLDKNKILCPDKTVKAIEYVNLPFGNLYTINVDPAFFASNEFSVEFNNNGALKKVTLNSDPQIDETITATAGLVKEVASLASTVAVSALAGPDIESCGKFKNETLICVQTYQEWKKTPCDYNP